MLRQQRDEDALTEADKQPEISANDAVQQRGKHVIKLKDRPHTLNQTKHALISES